VEFHRKVFGMNFVTISNRKFAGSQRLGAIYFKGGTASTSQFTFIDGECVEFTNDEMSRIPMNRIRSLSLSGIYSYIGYDVESNSILIKNDRIGRIPIFVFHKSGVFIISNSIWEIILN